MAYPLQQLTECLFGVENTRIVIGVDGGFALCNGDSVGLFYLG